jgi:hypothetical protein
MALQAAIDPLEGGHFLGDIPALILVAIVLGWLTPRESDRQQIMDKTSSSV